MGELRIAVLGDIVGKAGRRAVQQQLPHLRADYSPHVVIANAENARSGSGLSPELFGKFREMGIDALTLGDHVFRDRRVVALLESPKEPIARPANLSDAAPGKRFTRLAPCPAFSRPIVIVTVLGRIFFPMPANDPFECVDQLLAELADPQSLVIVEAHMETTSEKIALALHLAGRVAAVVGTHTHVPTADARVLAGGTAFITDLGMCGPYESVIGRDSEAVIRSMRTGLHVPYPVATDGTAMCGAIIRIDEGSGRALSIEGVQYPADHTKPPFAHP